MIKTYDEAAWQALLAGRVWRQSIIGAGNTNFKLINRVPNPITSGVAGLFFLEVFKVVTGMLVSDFGQATIIRASDDVGDAATPTPMSQLATEPTPALTGGKAKISTTGYSAGATLDNIPFPLGQYCRFGPWRVPPGLSIAVQITWAANTSGYASWVWAEDRA